MALLALSVSGGFGIVKGVNIMNLNENMGECGRESILNGYPQFNGFDIVIWERSDVSRSVHRLSLKFFNRCCPFTGAFRLANLSRCPVPSHVCNQQMHYDIWQAEKKHKDMKVEKLAVA